MDMGATLIITDILYYSLSESVFPSRLPSPAIADSGCCGNFWHIPFGSHSPIYELCSFSKTCWFKLTHPFHHVYWPCMASAILRIFDHSLHLQPSSHLWPFFASSAIHSIFSHSYHLQPFIASSAIHSIFSHL